MAFDASSFATDLGALADLLKPNNDPRPDGPVSAPAPAGGPGAIGPKDLLPGAQPPPVRGPKDPRAIWDTDEVEADDLVDERLDDGRERPRFEFLYKQAVETTDAFLGMSGKDPSSSNCESLVVRVELPDVESAKDIELDVRADSLRVASAGYRLATHLPHKVDHERGEAKWDGGKGALSVSLPIVREELFA